MKLTKTLLFGFGVQAQTEVFEVGVGGNGVDEEHKKNIQSIVIDQNWKDFDDRAQLLFAELFPQVVEDPDFLANEEKIEQEDAAMCENGRDPNGKKVQCDQTRSGSLAPRTRYQTGARKFRQLKILVLWLQQEQKFGRYCYYGCYCLPEGAHDLSGGGYGEPVDGVDRSCKNFNQCYECAKLGNSEAGIEPAPTCDGEVTKYRFKLLHNIDDDSKSIECMNKPDTCERRICECDKKLAENLARYESTWNENFHTRLGDGSWKYNEQCKKKGLGRYGKPQTCCGTDFPDMTPKQKGKQCCGYRPFDPAGERKCCENDKLRQEC